MPNPLTPTHIVGNNPLAVLNHTDGCGSPTKHTGEHRRASGFFAFVLRHSCAFSMAGRGGEPSGCRFQYAGLPHLTMCLPPQSWKVGSRFPRHTGELASMRTLSRLCAHSITLRSVFGLSKAGAA